MNLGDQIAIFRKAKSMTQEDLAQILNVSNQAVSKWESNQCCPDIQLLPQLADIFEVSMDNLFGREESKKKGKNVSDLPWEDDNTVRVVVYIGHELQQEQKCEEAETVRFSYDGAVMNVTSALSVTCGDVAGNVYAGASVICNKIGGSTFSPS